MTCSDFNEQGFFSYNPTTFFFFFFLQFLFNHGLKGITFVKMFIHNFSKWNSSNDVISDCRKQSLSNSWKNCRKKSCTRVGENYFLLGPTVYKLKSQKNPFYIGTKQTPSEFVYAKILFHLALQYLKCRLSRDFTTHTSIYTGRLKKENLTINLQQFCPVFHKSYNVDTH